MKRHLFEILAKAAGGFAWGIGFALGLVAAGYVAYEVLVVYDVLKLK
jgi:hypothetical protein